MKYRTNERKSRYVQSTSSYLISWVVFMQIHHIPQVVRTNPPNRYRYAIKLDLLVQERDLLRYTIDDLTIPLFPHPPVLSKNALAKGKNWEGWTSKEEEAIH